MTAQCDRLNCFKYDLKADVKFVYKTLVVCIPFTPARPADAWIYRFIMSPIYPGCADSPDCERHLVLFAHPI